MSDDQQAIRRFNIMGGVRSGSLLVLMLGIAVARSVIDGPYALGVVMAIAGMLGVFFGPYLLAKRWKSKTHEDQE